MKPAPARRGAAPRLAIPARCSCRTTPGAPSWAAKSLSDNKDQIGNLTSGCEASRSGRSVVRGQVIAHTAAAGDIIHLGVASGGRRGIRTPETLARPPVFKTGAINRSAIRPAQRL